MLFALLLSRKHSHSCIRHHGASQVVCFLGDFLAERDTLVQGFEPSLQSSHSEIDSPKVKSGISNPQSSWFSPLTARGCICVRSVHTIRFIMLRALRTQRRFCILLNLAVQSDLPRLDGGFHCPTPAICKRPFLVE